MLAANEPVTDGFGCEVRSSNDATDKWMQIQNTNTNTPYKAISNYDATDKWMANRNRKEKDGFRCEARSSSDKWTTLLLGGEGATTSVINYISP